MFYQSVTEQCSYRIMRICFSGGELEKVDLPCVEGSVQGALRVRGLDSGYTGLTRGVRDVNCVTRVEF